MDERSRTGTNSRYLLVVGIIVLVAGILVPSPDIEGGDTGFVKHFGGGVFCGFLWLYLYRYAAVKLSLLLELVTLYAVVSMLGVGVELIELGGTRTGLLHGSTDDTSWDLVANSLGALSVWLLYRLAVRSGRLKT